MKNKFVNYSINFIIKYHSYNDKDIERLKYGLEGLYLTITKIFIIFIISALLGIFVESLIVIFFYNILRFFGFGFHAENSIQCLFISIFVLNVIPFVMFNININTLTAIIISLICCGAFLVYAPAGTVKRPLKNKRKRLIRKFITFGVGIFYSTISIIYVPLRTYLLTALIIEVIGILPVLYIITKQPYNNYKFKKA